MAFLRPLVYHLNRFHPKQELAWLAYKAGKDLVLPWGRRSGKSDLAIEICIEDIEDYGKDCLYVAKTQKQARKIVWKKLKTRLKNHSDWVLRESKLEAEHIPSGGTLYLYGADIVPDNMTGSGYRIIVADERALWKKPEIVPQILSPMLGDFNGQMISISTKRGKNHFYELYEQAKKNAEKYFCLEATIFDNTFLSDEGRAKVLSEYEGGEANLLYKQEILNQFVVFAGQVFALDLETYVDKPWHPYEYEHSVQWRGVDHGYNDPMACVWVSYNNRRGYYQIHMEYKRSALLIKEHADSIEAMDPKRNYHQTISDIDLQVIAEFAAVGLHMEPADKRDKRARYLNIVNAMRVGKLKISENCKMLLKEIAQLTWEEIEKETGDDHLCDAAVYVWGGIVMPQVPEAKVYDEMEGFTTNTNKSSFTGQNFGD